MKTKKLDTRSVGLDVGLELTKWLTGAENLHYGYWEGLEICAGNMGTAQVAYTQRLFDLLPDTPCRILDIGGGAGETARKLIALGHQVEIVVPSAFLASRCRALAPEAIVHEAKFEEADLQSSFDVCLFSESYQYIPLPQGISKCDALLKPGGRVIIADCFRSDAYNPGPVLATVGGGHPIESFRRTLDTSAFKITHEEDVTTHVAPSVEIEQGLFNAVGFGLRRFDGELALKKTRLRGFAHWVMRRLMGARTRARLDARLNQTHRTTANFVTNNIYLMMVLHRA